MIIHDDEMIIHDDVKFFKVAIYKGIIITYSPSTHKFYAYDEDEIVASADTQEELEQKAETYLKRKTGLPMKAIQAGPGNRTFRMVKITSIKEGGYRGSAEAWVTWEDPHSSTGYGREKLWWHGRLLFRATPKNLELLKDAQEKLKQLENLQEELDKIMASFEEELTQKEFGLSTAD